MIKRCAFLIDDTVYSELKHLAKNHGITTGGMVRRLVNKYQGRPNYHSPEYRKWLTVLCNIGRLYGDDAAQKYITANPPPQ